MFLPPSPNPLNPLSEIIQSLGNFLNDLPPEAKRDVALIGTVLVGTALVVRAMRQ